MKSHKIQRLELVSDKIEGGDRKMNILCIRFSCPTKKIKLVCGLSWRGRPWPSSSSMAFHGEGGNGRGKGRRGGGVGVPWGAVGEGSVRPALFGPGLRAVREKKTARRKEKRRERKEKKKGRKKEKEEKGKKFEIWKFLERKINDNL
jgi:hypothetical protein